MDTAILPSQHDKTHFFFTFLGDVDVIHRNITKTAIPPIGMNLWTLDQMSHIRKTTRPRVTTTVTMLEREREREGNKQWCVYIGDHFNGGRLLFEPCVDKKGLKVKNLIFALFYNISLNEKHSLLLTKCKLFHTCIYFTYNVKILTSLFSFSVVLSPGLTISIAMKRRVSKCRL